MFYIYYLLDPSDGRLLYVGRSHKPSGRKYVFEKRTGLIVQLGISQQFTDFEKSCEAERRAIARHFPPFNKKIMSAKSMHGHRHSEETRALIGTAHRGKTLSEESRRLISESRKGKPTNLGKKWGPETLARMKAAAIRREEAKRG